MFVFTTRVLAAASCAFALACGSPTRPALPDSSPPAFFPSEGASLHYRLDLPQGSGPFPAVVVGHGSGRITLDEGSIHVPFLTGAGFAVLRYDKRGVGLSTGIYRSLTSQNSETQVAELAADMAAGVVFLKARPDIDARRIGLMGVSQAGWPMAAAARQSADVRFMIAINGSTLPVGTNIYYEGLPTSASLDTNYASLASFRGTPGWDPGPALVSLRIPSLWLLGAEDRQVPTRECVRALTLLRNEGGRHRFVVYQGFGHELSGSAFLYWPDILTWMSAEGLR